MTNIPIIHITVRDTPPPDMNQVVGRIYNPLAFKTYVPDYAPNRADLIDDDEEDGDVETKVVRRGRRPRPKSNETAETK